MRSVNKYILFILLMLCCNAAYSFENGNMYMNVRYDRSMNEFEKPFVDQIITNQ